jgi:hypothetical protein
MGLDLYYGVVLNSYLVEVSYFIGKELGEMRLFKTLELVQYN